MKRIYQGILILLSIAVFFSCKKQDDGKITKDNLKVGFIYIGSINDEGYTTSQNLGRVALESKGIRTMYMENVAENEECEKALEYLISNGCNVIYATSYGYKDYVIKAAQKYPKIYFSHCSSNITEPNLSSYFGKMYEARYLSGIAAGLKTKTNKIGYVAAFPIPEVIRGINSFTLGVQSVNPEATIHVIWTHSWDNPPAERNAALQVIEASCDVIAQHQDSTAAQMAAQEKGVFCIGYNTATPNAAPLAYLTAPVFHWATYITNNVERILKGNWEARFYWGGLKDKMVDLDKLTSRNDPNAAILIDKARTQIEEGKLAIFHGPLYDTGKNLVIPKDRSMSDEEIWNMDWFVNGVFQVN